MKNFIKKVFELFWNIFLVVLLIVGLIIYWFNSNLREKIDHTKAQKEFTIEGWKNSRNKLSMYNDLEKRYLKKGMKISELKELLGGTNTTRVYKSFWGEEICMQYNLGGVMFFYTASFDLIVCPDKRGLYVKSYKLLRSGQDDGETIYRDSKGNILRYK
jgi:hypothetical protein